MTAEAAVPATDLRSLYRHGLIGLLLVVVVFGGGLYWAASTDISGAVVANGTVIVDTSSKQIQHQDGGIVKEILVRNEDTVTAGQLLVRLDDTTVSAALGVVQSQLEDALIQQARLIAETGEKDTFTLPAELAGRADDPDIVATFRTQQEILTAHREARAGRVAQLNEQITQFDRQIEGLELQQTAIDTQLEILRKESADLTGLLKNQLVESSRVNALNKQVAEQEGERGRLIAAVAQTRATISERRLQMEQIQTDFQASALDELQKVRQALSELRQQHRAAEQKLARVDIRAPESGVVHESVVNTVGGVVAPGEVLMQIVPQNEALLVGIRVDPMDVDKLAVGQSVVLRLVSFDRRTTPEINGAIQTISPDYIQDKATGRQYFTARVAIPDVERAKLPSDVVLRPGIPVEAFATVKERSVMSYLVEPFTEQLNLAFRETDG